MRPKTLRGVYVYQVLSRARRDAKLPSLRAQAAQLPCSSNLASLNLKRSLRLRMRLDGLLGEGMTFCRGGSATIFPTTATSFTIVFVFCRTWACLQFTIVFAFRRAWACLQFAIIFAFCRTRACLQLFLQDMGLFDIEYEENSMCIMI